MRNESGASGVVARLPRIPQANPRGWRDRYFLNQTRLLHSARNRPCAPFYTSTRGNSTAESVRRCFSIEFVSARLDFQISANRGLLHRSSERKIGNNGLPPGI